MWQKSQKVEVVEDHNSNQLSPSAGKVRLRNCDKWQQELKKPSLWPGVNQQRTNKEAVADVHKWVVPENCFEVALW